MEEKRLLVYECYYPANQAESDRVFLFKYHDSIYVEIEKISGLETIESRILLPEELIKNEKVQVLKLLNHIKEQSIPIHYFHSSCIDKNEYIDIKNFILFTSQDNKTNKSRLKGDLIEKTKPKFAPSLEWDVDLVFCIDNSENMKEHIDRVKEWIPEIIDRYANACPLNIYGIRNFKARLIVFNDYRLNSESAILTTDFFDLKNDKNLFLKVLKSIEIQPGATKSVCGLEALTYAAYSKWSEYFKRRRYIWVFSNSNTNSIGNNEVVDFYPKGVPKSAEEFIYSWKHLNDNYTIWFMTPYEEHWNMAIDNLQSICFPSAAGEGLKEDNISYEELFGAIVLGFD